MLAVAINWLQSYVTSANQLVQVSPTTTTLHQQQSATVGSVMSM